MTSCSPPGSGVGPNLDKFIQWNSQVRILDGCSVCQRPRERERARETEIYGESAINVCAKCYRQLSDEWLFLCAARLCLASVSCVTKKRWPCTGICNTLGQATGPGAVTMGVLSMLAIFLFAQHSLQEYVERWGGGPRRTGDRSRFCFGTWHIWLFGCEKLVQAVRPSTSWPNVGKLAAPKYACSHINTEPRTHIRKYTNRICE